MKRVQMSVYVTPEVAERLRVASGLAGVPVGRHVGDMLDSLLDSVEFVSGKIAEARRSPDVVLQRLRALDSALGVNGPSRDVTVEAERGPARPQVRGRAGPRSATPPSNTGVNSAMGGAGRV